MNPRIESLEKLLDGPRDGAMLRFSIGNEYLKAGKPEAAAASFKAAIERNPNYSAAWKGLGKALGEAGDLAGGLNAYTEGIRIAEAQGDLQAAKEMRVFAKRLGGSSPNA
jgi:predicted Zn-dependent protease